MKIALNYDAWTPINGEWFWFSTAAATLEQLSNEYLFHQASHHVIIIIANKIPLSFHSSITFSIVFHIEPVDSSECDGSNGYPTDAW